MSLITCPECGNKISSQASACPKCGSPTPADVQKTKIKLRNKKGNMQGAGIIMMIIGAGLAAGSGGMDGTLLGLVVGVFGLALVIVSFFEK